MGSIARRSKTTSWTSLFVAGSLLFVTTQIAAEEHAVLDKEMFLAAPGSTIARLKTRIEQDCMGSWLRDWIESIRIQARR